MPLRDQFPKAEIVVVEHHLAHAASAFFASPFEEATVLTLDQAGDFRCGARWHATGYADSARKGMVLPRFARPPVRRRDASCWAFAPAPTSIRCSGSPPRATSASRLLFREIVSAAARLDASFFDGHRLAAGGFSAKFFERAGIAGRRGIPAAAGAVDRARLAEDRRRDGAGAGRRGRKPVPGRRTVFQRAAGRVPGTHAAAGKTSSCKPPRAMRGRRSARCITSGTRCTAAQAHDTARDRCCSVPATARTKSSRCWRIASCGSTICVRPMTCWPGAVRMLGEHKILAWMQGRMEFGPRALGNRSILASPLDPYSTENLNVFIKHREPFRKFAASVPAELAAEYFETGPNARHLATVGRVRPKHRKTFEAAILGEDMVRVAHGRGRGQSPVSSAACTKPGRRPVCRCSTTPASIYLAIRWFRRRAMRCAASTRRASTRCSWGIFCWRSEEGRACPAPTKP